MLKFSIYPACFVEKVCGPLWSTWGAPLREGKSGVKVGIVNTKVARQARTRQTPLDGAEAFGGRATLKLPFTACTTSNPQTHEIQVFHLHSRLSKGFCDPCLGHVKVLPWVVDGAGGLGAGKTSGAGTRGVDLNAAVGGRTGYTDTNGGESSNN